MTYDEERLDALEKRLAALEKLLPVAPKPKRRKPNERERYYSTQIIKSHEKLQQKRLAD